MSNTELAVSSARRKILFTLVSTVCYEAGFSAAEKSVLETLTEMFQSCLSEIGRSSRSYCELGGRTEGVVGDVLMALVEMGLNVESLFAYAKRPTKFSLPTPTSLPRTAISHILQAGEKRSLPGYIPDHYPPFPDPHTYIRTPTHRQPLSEYEVIREKSATQRRDVERALTRFIAKTGCTQSLFPDDVTLFPLIACKPSPNPYFSALLFTDQIFDEEPPPEKANKPGSPTHYPEEENQEAPKDTATDGDIMDNPYLRPTKLTRKRRK